MWAKLSKLLAKLVKRCECASCELRRRVLKGRHRDKGS
jgi:hypothetical protein